jgi:hypothetical protein
LHAQKVVDPETGVERRKFGGPQPNSGRRKRVAQTATEYFSEDERQKLLLEALEASIHPSQTAGERRRGALAILEVIRKEEQDQREERRVLEQAERTRIVGDILRGLVGAPGTGAGDVVEGDFSELDPGGSDGVPGVVRALEAPRRADD